MNKLYFLVILIVTCQSSFSQNYKFDIHFTYNFSLQNEPRNIYCNSTDKNIFLEIRSDVYGLYTSLKDLNKNEHHRFKIDTTRVENNLHLSFTYEYTSKIKIENNGNQIFEYEKTFEDSTHSMGFLKIFKDKKKKKISEKYNIKVLKGDINYFNIFRYLYMHSFEKDKNLDIQIGGIVESTNFFNGETNVSAQLISVNGANLNIVVPNNKNIKTFNY